MRAWCDKCGRYVEYTQEIEVTEELEIKGTKFNALQTYGICPVCGDEVLSNDQADKNVHRAHNAYRRALGSITAEEIQDILTMYNIGAQPLSNLLGWGANTIERQMKHTVPSKEHARRLRELKNPSAMYELLESNKNRITELAYKKALKAVFEHHEFDIHRQAYSDVVWSTSVSGILGIFFKDAPVCIIKGKRRKEYSQEYTPQHELYQLAFSGGK
ncbi:MAG: hypothetical protein Q4C10_07235 [Clostridia bacterium]|nr:hypothetical protein [Clostridia bacterium]